MGSYGEEVKLKITVISQNTPMGDELKELLKEGVGGGHIFKSCDISLENTPTSGS